jgi:hypothetical protein
MAAIERVPAWQEKSSPQQLQTTDKPDISCVVLFHLSAHVGIRRTLAHTHLPLMV